jgi:hypothetical protein
MQKIVVQFALLLFGVIPKRPRFYQRAEGSPALPAPRVSQNTPLPSKRKMAGSLRAASHFVTG